jgi:hypothetical protein
MRSRYCTSSRNQGIDLLQTEWCLWAALQIAADEAIFLDAHLQRGGAGFIDCRRAVLLGQGEHAEDAADADFSLLAMDGLAERADVRSGATGAPQQLGSAQRCSLGVVLGLVVGLATSDRPRNSILGWGRCPVPFGGNAYECLYFQGLFFL